MSVLQTEKSGENRGVALAESALLSRACLLLSWGVPLSVLLLWSDAFLVLGAPALRVPAYILGALLSAWGSWCWLEYAQLRRDDAHGAGMLLFLSVMQVYLAPFVVWHDRLSMEPFFAGSFLTLALVLQLHMVFAVIGASQALHDLERPLAARWLDGLFYLMFTLFVLMLLLVVWEVARSFYRPYGIMESRLWMLLRAGRRPVSALLLLPALLTWCACRKAHGAALAHIMDASPAPDADAAQAGVLNHGSGGAS